MKRVEIFTEGEVEINRHDCTDIYNIDPDTGECRVCRAESEDWCLPTS